MSWEEACYEAARKIEVINDAAWSVARMAIKTDAYKNDAAFCAAVDELDALTIPPRSVVEGKDDD